MVKLPQWSWWLSGEVIVVLALLATKDMQREVALPPQKQGPIQLSLSSRVVAKPGANLPAKPMKPVSSSKTVEKQPPARKTPPAAPRVDTKEPVADDEDVVTGEMDATVQVVETPPGLQELSEQKQLADARFGKQLERDAFITPFQDKSEPLPVKPPVATAEPQPGEAGYAPKSMPMPGITLAEKDRNLAADLRLLDNLQGPTLVNSGDWIKTHPVLFDQEMRDPPVRLFPGKDAEADEQIQRAAEEWFELQPMQVQVDFNTRLTKALWLSVELNDKGQISRYVVMGGNTNDKLQTAVILGQLRWQTFTFDPPMKPGETAWMRLLIDFSYEP